ncbi:hypothetical protein [Bartonella machadoae]|uniref:hypothetical protein n=1 Tax=Bartonella machadoae TaxID=2893471 RepID=UPI001F4C9B43|nr:hypothetical protein [Bartonella machadoae]UNE55143.1 hypothetical protein LNM86_04770 [Bartonella machadoae]
MLKNMFPQAEKMLHGTTLLTLTYEKDKVRGRDWICPMQEHAFAICDEYEKPTVIPLVGDI